MDKTERVAFFRIEDNALRIRDSCEGTLMAKLPVEKFEEAVLKAVKLNERFIPPYESGASLYIRPVLFGTGAQVGVKPADEYVFIDFCNSGGSLFQGGFQTTPFVIMREYVVRLLGMGKFKVGGNYAASLVAGEKAHHLGYSNIFI